MLRLQLSEQDQHQQSENENENDALVGNSLPSAYGSISSANGHASTRSKNCPSVPSVNGVLSLSTEGASAGDEDYNEEDNDDISIDEDDDDIDSEISYEDSSEDEEQAFYQGKGKIRWRSIECKVMEPVIIPIVKLYRLIRDAVILITNTDDVWDSPAFDTTTNHRRDRSGSIQSNSSGSTLQQRQGYTRRLRDIPPTVSLRHKFVVFFWILVLATFYALERTSFKIMTDRMGPFRMVIGVEVVLAMHAIIGGTLTFFRWVCRNKAKRANAGLGMLPLADVGLMAVLDTIQLLLVVISGSHVAPILTAILVHVTIPITTCINHIIGPKGCLHDVFLSADEEKRHNLEEVEHTRGSVDSDRQRLQSSQMNFGATLIMVSSILALAPAVLTLIYPNIMSYRDVMGGRSAWNTLLFIVSFIPGSISQAYKERTLETYAQPVDQDILNAILSLFSAVFAFLVSPIFYPLQGFADLPSSSDLQIQNWIQQYPSKDVSRNFGHGLQCFIGTLDNDVQVRGYPEQAHCDFAYGFVLLHVFSIFAIGSAVGKICNAGAFKIMHRGISAGIILSVVALFFYQVFVDNVEYGFLPIVFHITCAFVLVIGSEVYHRVTLESPSFETRYLPVTQYEDE
eukprot:scaffold1264_cov263-Chaetoceros_neogracile.AAC.4